MQTFGNHTLVAPALLLALTTGCASLQADLPPGYQEDVPPARTDYIDDRGSTTSLDEGLQIEDLDEVDTFDAHDRGETSKDRRPIRQFSLLAGGREFSNDGIWDRVDAELSLGLEYAHEVSDGIGFELGAVGSIGTEAANGAGVDVTGAAAELYGGARYFLRRGRWTPYVGGGLSAILAGVDNDVGGQVADDQDFSLGFYLHGGVQYNLNDIVFLGLDLRTLQGTSLELETITGSADYVQLGFVLGFRL